METAQPQFFLRGESLAPFFKRLCDGGHTGLLAVRHHGTVRSILLREGQPVFATSNDREQRLNGYLLRLGLVTLPDLVEAVERMVRLNRRLGEILVEMRLLDPDHLVDALRHQVREIICTLLSTVQGQFSFHGQPVDAHSEIGFSLPPNALIRESISRVHGFHRILDEIGGLSAVYQATERCEEEVRTAGLPPGHMSLIPLLRPPVSLEQICAATEVNDFEVCQAIWVLLAIKAIARLE